MGTAELNTYLRDNLDTPFKLGVHDCLIFTNNCWHALFGHGWADDWLDSYMHAGKPVARTYLRRKMGFDSLIDAVDSRFQRNSDIYKHQGSIVAKTVDDIYAGIALGVVLDHRAVFVGNEGLHYCDVREADIAWHPVLKGTDK